MMVGNEIASRYKAAPYIFFVVVPILLIPLWMTAELGWFRFAKLIAIIVGSMFITISRFNLGPKHLKIWGFSRCVWSGVQYYGSSSAGL